MVVASMDLQKIVVATSNPGKILEIQAMFAEKPWQLVKQSDLNVHDAEETGLSFVENALIKARHAAQITGLPAIADDSGIVVDALNGAPGIYSARFAGHGASNEANNALLLEKLRDIKPPHRTARFYCAIVFVRHALDPIPIICEGSWEGSILEAPSGTKGFGYDPLFYVAEKQCSAADLSVAEKNLVSHRGQALGLLRKKLY